jgi:hypothetical protein
MLRHSSNFFVSEFKISLPRICDFIQISKVTVSLSWRGTLFECGEGKTRCSAAPLAAQNG